MNFARGANPPREQWKAPPQRTPEETEGAFVRFAEYLDHVVASPGIKLVTATNLPTLYADPVRQSGASESDLHAVVQRLSGAGKSGIDYLSVGGKVLSVADQFELLAAALVERIEGRAPTFPHPIPGLLGPDHEAFATEMNSVPWSDFREAVRDAQNYLKANGRVPARVFIGAEAIPPLDFLTGMAFALNEQRKNGSLPARILLQPGLELLPARHVAKDTPDLFGGWVIHPTGFRAPKILEVARLQAWTLKPAVLAGE